MRSIIRFALRRLKGSARGRRADNRVLTIPNIITMSGIIGTFVYAYLFVTEAVLWLVPLAHLFVVLSDVLDGVTADILRQHTRVGKVLDPVRDRLHAFATFVNLGLLSENPLASRLLLVAFGTELILTALAYRAGGFEAHMVGKARAAIHGLCAAAVLVAVYWLGHTPDMVIVAGIMAAASIAALWFYAQRSFGLRKQPS